MNDAELRAALRTLERVTAPPRFTSETLRKLGADVAPRPRWRLVAASAMTVMLVAGTYAASIYRARTERLAMIRAKRQRIESELRDVKALQGAPQGSHPRLEGQPDSPGDPGSRQQVPMDTDPGHELGPSCAHGPRAHPGRHRAPGKRENRLYLPHRSAAVWTGASHRRSNSSSSRVNVTEHPAISSEVTKLPTSERARVRPSAASRRAAASNIR